MAELVYVLCALTSLACALLLLRGYASSRSRLLLWSGLCFLGLAANNVLLFVDRVLVPAVDLGVWRIGTSLTAVAVLVYGLVWDAS